MTRRLDELLPGLRQQGRVVVFVNDDTTLPISSRGDAPIPAGSRNASGPTK
jgi:hypothetical protein